MAHAKRWAIGMILAAGTWTGLAASSASAQIAQPVAKAERRGAPFRIDTYAKVLKLDETQTATARQFYEAMTREQQKASRRMREAFEESDEDRKIGEHKAAEGRMDKAIREHRAASERLTTQFLDDLKALLRADQQDNWTKFEQLRRRELYLRGGTVGGSSIDLMKIVDELKLAGEPQTKAQEILSQYEPDLDKALQEREKNAKDDQKTFGGIQQFDEKSLKAHMDRTRATDMRVREVNMRYLRQLVAVLPEDLGKTLEERYQMKAYRSAYRETKTGRNLTEAGKLKDLTDEQRRRLAELQERYARDAKAAGDRWAAARQKAEDEGRGGFEPFMIAGPGITGPQGDPDIEAAQKGRRDVDSWAKQQLEQILTPDQIAAIPKPDAGAGQRVEVISDGGDEVVVVSDLDEEDLPPPGSGGAVIIRTVDISSPPGGQSPPPAQPPKPD